MKTRQFARLTWCDSLRRLCRSSAVALAGVVLWMALPQDVGLGVGSTPTALAQMVPAPPQLNVEGGRRESEPAETRDMDLVEKLGDRVPFDIELVNEQGDTVRLGDFFNADRPVIINLGYYGCPMLCGQMIRGLGMSLHELEQRDGWVPGQDYEVVTISFDGREGPDIAAEAKQSALQMLQDERAGEGWHFLTGKETNVRQIADALGFPYRWSERGQQYIHPAAIMLLTPDGRISRYLYGVSYPTTTLRLSLVESSEGQVGSTMDRIILYCFQFDDAHGEYTLVAMNLMRLAGAMTVVVLVIAVGIMSIRGARRQAAYGTFESPSPDTDSKREQ